MTPAAATKLNRLPLLEHFEGLKDPHQRGKVLYPLDEIVLLLVCATTSG